MKLKGKHASSHISVLSTSRRPSAIVILLGWVGAEKNDFDRFARIFQGQNCSTVCATAVATSVRRNDTVSSSELATIVCREAARLVRMAEFSAMGGGYIPIHIHAFGNGGSFLLKQIENVLSEVNETVVHEQISAIQSFKQKSKICLGVPSLTSSELSGDTISTLSHSEDSGTSQQIQSSKSPFQPPKRISQHWRSTKVHRKELERTALNASRPTVPHYNEDEKACSRDMSLVLKRTQLGHVIMDATPLEHEKLLRWSTKITALYNRTWMRQRKNGNHADAQETICNNTAHDNNMVFFANLKEQSTVLTNHIEYVYSTYTMPSDPTSVEEVVRAQSLRGIHMRTWKLNSHGEKKNAKERTFEYRKIVEALLSEESHRMKLLNQDSSVAASTKRKGQGRERCERLYAKMYANLLDEIGYRSSPEKTRRSTKNNNSPERMCEKICRRKDAGLSCSGNENENIVKEPVEEKPLDVRRSGHRKGNIFQSLRSLVNCTNYSTCN
eukprot:scaffold39564_cov50-Attheya_sp.AAC.3